MADILVAGLDTRSLLLEAPVLQRQGGALEEKATVRDLLDTLARGAGRCVVLGSLLPDQSLADAIKKIRSLPATRQVSILVVLGSDERTSVEASALTAGANAVLRRPLDGGKLEGWVAKLLEVPRRVDARVPVQGQVVGSARIERSGHFYGLSRNLSVHGMLLASPVRIEAEDLDLEIDLPESDGRVRVLGRVARQAPEVGWPYFGYGIEFLFLPETAQRVIDRLVRRETPQEPPRSLWTANAIHSTLRKDGWIYELSDPVRTDCGFLVEIRRASREDWRAGRGSPYYVVADRTPESALAAARGFVFRHG
jgi:CheY-like chemotaxis protein